MIRTKTNRRREMSATIPGSVTRRSGFVDFAGPVLSATCVTPAGAASPAESCAAFAKAFLAVFPDGSPFGRQPFRVALTPRDSTCVRVGDVVAFVDVSVLDDRICFGYWEVLCGVYSLKPACRAELAVPRHARTDASEGAAQLRRT